jgi:WD40 repeat protein
MAGDLSPDGARFVTGGQNNIVRVWNAVTGELAAPPIAVHTSQVVDVRFSPDGRRFASASFDGTARVWDTATGREVGQPRRHDSAITKAMFSADGARLATTSEDNTARIWDVATGQPVAPTLAHPAWTLDAEFSQDGTRLLTAMRRTAARFWNAQTGQPISPFIAHNSGRVLQASFTADESHFITCTTDGGVFFWPIPFDDRPSADLIRLAEVYQGWRIDSFGGFSTIPADEFRAIWDDMHERYPADFAVSTASRRAWHWKEMKAALKEGKVYGALFHGWVAMQLN